VLLAIANLAPCSLVVVQQTKEQHWDKPCSKGKLSKVHEVVPIQGVSVLLA